MPYFKLKLFSFTAIKWLFLTFYFEIILDLQEVAKIVQRSPVSPSQFVPVVRSYIAVGQYQNQEMDIGTLTRRRPYSDFVSFYVWGKRSSVQFILCICLWHYHHNQDTEFFHHHKGTYLCATRDTQEIELQYDHHTSSDFHSTLLLGKHVAIIGLQNEFSHWERAI